MAYEDCNLIAYFDYKRGRGWWDMVQQSDGDTLRVVCRKLFDESKNYRYFTSRA